MGVGEVPSSRKGPWEILVTVVSTNQLRNRAHYVSCSDHGWTLREERKVGLSWGHTRFVNPRCSKSCVRDGVGGLYLELPRFGLKS